MPFFTQTDDSKEKVSDDLEGRAEPRSSVGSKEKEDPFGDESNSEVKYRTMAWWWVPLFYCRSESC